MGIYSQHVVVVVLDLPTTFDTVNHVSRVVILKYQHFRGWFPSSERDFDQYANNMGVYLEIPF